MVKPDFQGWGQCLIWLNTVLKHFATPEPKERRKRKMDRDAKVECQTSTVQMTEATPIAFNANAGPVLLPRLKKDWMQSAVGPQWGTALSTTAERGWCQVCVCYQKTRLSDMNKVCKALEQTAFMYFFPQNLSKAYIVLHIKLNMLTITIHDISA